jgi:alpha-tubulin suppressor-like RCC1 family protein
MQITRQWSSVQALLSDGSILVGGKETFGGTGEDYNGAMPYVQLGLHDFSGRRIVKLAGNNSHSRNSSTWYMALDEHGDLWLWGYNGYGQCGIGPENFNNTGYGLANRTDNVRAPRLISREQVFNNKRIVDIFSMEHSAFALDEDGYIWSWGRNNYGQLGQRSGSAYGTYTNDWMAVPRRIEINWGTYGGIQKICTPSYENQEWLMVLDGQGHDALPI